MNGKKVKLNKGEMLSIEHHKIDAKWKVEKILDQKELKDSSFYIILS